MIIFCFIVIIIIINCLRIKLFCNRCKEKPKEKKIIEHIAKKVALEKSLEQAKKKDKNEQERENIEEIRVIPTQTTIYPTNVPYVVGDKPPPYPPQFVIVRVMLSNALQPCNVRCHGEKPGKCANQRKWCVKLNLLTLNFSNN